MPFLEHEIEKYQTFQSESQMGWFSCDSSNFAKVEKPFF